MNTTEKNISWNDIKMFIGFSGILTSIIISWATLNSKVDLINQKTDTISEKQIAQDVRIQTLESKQNDMSDKIVRLQTIIDINANRTVVNMVYPSDPDKILKKG